MDIADSGDNLIGARRRIARFGSPIRRVRERILRYGMEIVSLSEVVKVLRGSIHVHGELVNRLAHNKEPLMEERFFRAQKRSSALLPN